MLVQVWIKWNVSNPESFNNVKWFWMKSAMNHRNYASLSQQCWPHARAVVIHRLHRLCTVTKIGDFNQIATAVVDAESWGEHVRLRSQPIENFSVDDGDGSENVTHRTDEFAFSQFLSRLFQLAENVKWRRISLELISLGTVLKFKKRRKICQRLFTSSIKREIRHFHVVVAQWRQRNVQKSVMHVQSCCFT